MDHKQGEGCYSIYSPWEWLLVCLIVARKNADETSSEYCTTNNRLTLEAPRLIGVSTEDFVKFKNAPEIYERRLEAKNKDEGINAAATSFWR